ncbi:30S ribosomal protein S17 [Corynebacterium liangguodongii]|uniref:Small ribosomal subunit protein uS17 n=1 Tax=Corynebacterium liangguodongii TaxID=2079535 RepID=A0A2S0WC99_9CORY|nr:30S ribosomal protein S17 [Corynebacterium liangguodongii]PWC00536.1 30S ribosomal protein S17 [Corynebacterium liangguodongii]
MTEATEGNVTVTEDNANKTKKKGLQKRRRGYVVSDKMDKTIVVEVEDRKSHALYGKIVRTTKRVKAHDEDNTAGVGDLVIIEETRPLSKDKHFRLFEIVEKAR